MDTYGEEIEIQKKQQKQKYKILFEITIYIASYFIVNFFEWFKFSYILYLALGISFTLAVINEHIQRKAVKKAKGKHYFFYTTKLYMNDLRKIISEILIFDPEHKSDVKDENEKNKLQLITGKNKKFQNIEDLKASLYFGYTYFLAIVSPSEKMSVIVNGNPQASKEYPSYTKLYCEDDSEQAQIASKNIKKIIKKREIHISILLIINWLLPIILIFAYDVILSKLITFISIPVYVQLLLWIIGINIYTYIQNSFVSPNFIDKVYAAEKK